MANTTFSGPVRSENGFQDITKNATTGAVTTNSTYGNNAAVGGTLTVTGATTLTGGMVGGVQEITGAGAVDLTTLVTEITTDSADAFTLADGTQGQMKIIVGVDVSSGDATLTPATFANGTTITFGAAGESVTLVYTASGWNVVGINGATVA